jgi:hypothetical protein
VEREAEQTALAAAGNERRDVEERRARDGAVLENDDASSLKSEEEAGVTGIRDPCRLREPGRDWLERDLRDTLSPRAASSGENADDREGCEKTGSRGVQSLPPDRENDPPAPVNSGLRLG